MYKKHVIHDCTYNNNYFAQDQNKKSNNIGNQFVQNSVKDKKNTKNDHLLWNYFTKEKTEYFRSRKNKENEILTKIWNADHEPI